MKAISSIYLLLILNTFLDIFDVFLPLFTTVIRGSLYAIFFYLLLLNLKKIEIDKIGILIFVFLGYLTLLIPFSSDIVYTLRQLIILAFTFFIYIVSYNLFNKKTDFKNLKYLVYIILALYVLNALFFTITRLGPSVYGESGIFLTGSLSHNKVYPGSVVFLFTPLAFLFIKKQNQKILLILLGTLFVIVVLLTLRRSAILVILLGIICYLFFSSERKNIFTLIFTFIVLATLLYPLYGFILEEQILARSNVLIDKGSLIERGIASEARGREILSVSNMVYSFDDLSYTLFGTELFNSMGTYNSLQYTFPPSRPLHTDYGTILHGSGIVGFFIYSSIFISILFKFFIVKRNKSQFDKSLNVLFITMFFILLLTTITGGIVAISFRSLLFFIFGATIGYYDNTSLKRLNK